MFVTVAVGVLVYVVDTVGVGEFVIVGVGILVLYLRFLRYLVHT